MVMLEGLGASPGAVEGTGFFVADPYGPEADRFPSGAILLTEQTTPEFVPLMKRAGGILTETGGATCHAAIVSRELEVPCVVACGSLRKLHGKTIRFNCDSLSTIPIESDD